MTFWTPQHTATLLPAVLIGFLVAVLLRLLIGRARLWVRMIPMQLLSLLLLAMEMQKQISSIRAGYDYYYLPFHFCSLLLLIFPLASFYFGRGSETLRSLALTAAATVSLITLIAPEQIFSYEHVQNFETEFFACHTVIFHCVVPIFFMMMLMLDVTHPRVGRDLAITVIVVALYSVLAAYMAKRFETNFSNFYYCKIEKYENIRLEWVAEMGEEKARRLYMLVVGGVHIVGNVIGYLVGSLLSYVTRCLPFGETARFENQNS